MAVESRKEQPRIRRICTVYTSPDGVCVRTYGVEVASRQGVALFPDVALESAAVDVLIDRLRVESVEPCHLADVVADYIGELAIP